MKYELYRQGGYGFERVFESRDDAEAFILRDMVEEGYEADAYTISPLSPEREAERAQERAESARRMNESFRRSLAAERKNRERIKAKHAENPPCLEDIPACRVYRGRN